LWLLLCGLIAALIAGFLLLVLVLITPQEATPSAIAATSARMVTSYWEGDLLMVQCAGFQPGDTVTIFITPSMAEVNSTREGITVLQAGPQGNCPSGGVWVDADIALREGWLLVALGSRAGDIASTPFIAMPEVARPSQPRQAIAVQVQPAQADLAAPQKLDHNIWSVELYPDRDQNIDPIYSDPIFPGRYKLEWYAKNYPVLPPANFGAVFIGEFDFDGIHSYLFTLNAKGIARVFIDDMDNPKIDAYRIGVKRAVAQRIPLSAGLHKIRVEYYSDGGPAWLTLNWEADGKRNDYWLARYYNNELMSPPVAMIRHDNTLTFEWSNAPGEGVNEDNFSVQWLREVIVPKNGYTCRMSVYETDKVRVFVGSNQVPELSNWDAPNAWDRTAKILSGRHLIEVQFVHHTGPAKIQLICEL
jgi:hypothetical protein